MSYTASYQQKKQKEKNIEVKKFAVLVCIVFAAFNILCLSAFDVFAKKTDRTDSSINGQTFSKRLNYFYNHLTKLPRAKMKNVFDQYEPVVAKEINMEYLYFSTYQELETLLNQAVSESIDVLTLFTHPMVQQNKTLVLDKKKLSKLNHHYNLHGLFLISSSDTAKNSKVQMTFLVAGQGKLIIGYDKNITIAHPDYSFGTGKYDYQKLFIMNAKSDDRGNYGLFDIRGLSDPLENFSSMTGPLNSKIKSLSFLPAPETDKKILVQYELFGSGKKVISCIPIEKLLDEEPIE